MKTLVVYYSLEGHTEIVAKLLSEELGADLLKLELLRPFPNKGFKKYFWCGKSSVFREKPALRTKMPDLNQYDLIVIGTPIWAGNCASPINSLIDIVRNDYALAGKKIGLLVTNGGGSIKKCVKQIEKTLNGCIFLKPLHFINPSKEQREEIVSRIKTWINENLRS